MLTNGNTYYYTITAIDDSTEYPETAPVAATPGLGQWAYWKFNESSGTKAIDAWGAYHGTLQAAATRIAGKYNHSLKLNGTNTSYVALPSDITSTLDSFTVAAWIRTDAKANWVRVFDFGKGTNHYMFLSIQAGSANVIRNAIKNGGNEQNISVNYNLPLNAWVHFAITQSGNTCNLYINDSLVKTGSVTIKPYQLGSTGFNYLGKSQFAGDGYFNGAVDDFKIYNRALSVSEIAGIMKGSQTITLNAPSQKQVGDSDFDAAATASSGLPVTLASSDTAVATIVNGMIHIAGAGTVTITASQAGDSIYNAAAPVAKTLTILPLHLRVQYSNGDTQLTNNTIKPYLKIINADSIVVAYKELTVRYWFTVENYAGINNRIDYAQLGNSKVKMKYVELAQPHNGALGYVEYSFDTTAGNLAAGNSGAIQSRLANKDWSVLNEADDYSYNNNTSYADNDHITLYRNGNLVWGTEPSAATPVTKLKLYYQNQNTASNTNTVKTYLKIGNEGNTPVSYKDISVRYWFTKEGTSSLSYVVDFAKLGNAKSKRVISAIKSCC